MGRIHYTYDLLYSLSEQTREYIRMQIVLWTVAWLAARKSTIFRMFWAAVLDRKSEFMSAIPTVARRPMADEPPNLHLAESNISECG